MASQQWAKHARTVMVASVAMAAVACLPSSAGAAESVTSPGCDASLEARLDWASDVDAEQAAAGERSAADTATEQLRAMYTLARLCEGDVVRQSGFALYGPKDPGEAPSSAFRPTGSTESNQKVRRKGVRGRAARVLTCTNTAYDPQFTGGTVRAGGRSGCNQTTSLSATTCIGRYFQSSGNSDQAACKGATVNAAAITIYTDYITCYDVISYRTNFYGVTGNAYSFYFNGMSNGCN